MIYIKKKNPSNYEKKKFQVITCQFYCRWVELKQQMELQKEIASICPDKIPST